MAVALLGGLRRNDGQKVGAQGRSKSQLCCSFCRTDKQFRIGYLNNFSSFKCGPQWLDTDPGMIKAKESSPGVDFLRWLRTLICILRTCS